MKLILFVLLILSTLILNAERPVNVYLGIEISELMQNRFRDLGLNNMTIFAGQRMNSLAGGKFGWEAMYINVKLSREHLADSKHPIH